MICKPLVVLRNIAVWLSTLRLQEYRSRKDNPDEFAVKTLRLGDAIRGHGRQSIYL